MNTPGPRQMLLLRAAVGGAQAVRQASESLFAPPSWLEDLDDASYRLLPQLYRNLETHGVSAEIMTKLRGVYRHSWYRNHMLLHATAGCVRVLHDAGLTVIALKGAAVAALYPGGVGCRPMDDVDLLVMPGDATRAAAVLEAQGFFTEPRSAFRDFFHVRHALAFRRKDGLEIDLHWSLMAAFGNDVGVWQRAHRSDLSGVELLVPSPADQLLHTCVHGLGFYPAPLRWMADALLILHANTPLDWNVFIEEAQDRDLTVVASEALRLLHTELAAPVPPWVIVELNRSCSSRTSRLAHRLATGQIVVRHGAAYVDLWDRYRRREGLCARRPTVRGYLRFVADSWGLPNQRALASVLLRKTRQVIQHGASDPGGTFQVTK